MRIVLISGFKDEHVEYSYGSYLFSEMAVVGSPRSMTSLVLSD